MATSYSVAIEKVVYRTILKMYLRGFSRQEMDRVIAKAILDAKRKFSLKMG